MSENMRHLMPELVSTMLSILLFGMLLSLIPVLIKRWLISNGKMDFNYRAKRIMTGNEMEFFQRLRRANPDGYVFPQVAFSALLEPSSRNKWAALKYIAQKTPSITTSSNCFVLLNWMTAHITRKKMQYVMVLLPVQVLRQCVGRQAISLMKAKSAQS